MSRRCAALLLALCAAPPARAMAPASDGDQRPPRSFPSPARYARARHGGIALGGDAARGLVALTFDDGPSSKTTPLVLDALAREGAPATFFVNAYRLGGRSEAAQAQRALLLEEVARGHDVGNHTFDHARLSSLAPAAQEKEILDGERGIERVLGERAWLFRPPYGRMAPAAASLLARRGDTVVEWNVSSDDPYLRTPDKVLAHVMEELGREGGGVILFHDTHAWTAAALPRFFDAVRAESCRRVARGEAPFVFVALDRLLLPRYGLRRPGEDTLSEARERRERERIVAGCARVTSNAPVGVVQGSTP